MRRLFLLCLLALGPATNNGPAQTQSASPSAGTVEIGGLTIEIPEPEGFKRLDGINSQVDAALRASAPPSNRLIAFYASPADLEAAKRGPLQPLEMSFNVQTVREFEKKNIGPADFISFKNYMKKEHTNLVEKIRPELKSLEKSLSSNLSNALDARVSLKVGDIVPLGVIGETENSFSMAMLAKAKMTTPMGASSPEITQAIAYATLHVGNRMFLIYVNRLYQSETDLAIAKGRLKQWAQAIVDANQKIIKNPPKSNVPVFAFAGGDKTLWILGGIAAALALLYGFSLIGRED